jgi:hypothetical protein
MLRKNVCQLKIYSNLSKAMGHSLHVEITWVIGRSFRRLASMAKERGVWPRKEVQVMHGFTAAKSGLCTVCPIIGAKAAVRPLGV